VSIHHLRFSINIEDLKSFVTHPLHVFSSSPHLGFLEKEGHLKYTLDDALNTVINGALNYSHEEEDLSHS